MDSTASISSNLDQYPLPDTSDSRGYDSSTFWSRLQQRWSGDYHFRLGYYILGANLFLLAIISIIAGLTEGGSGVEYAIFPIVSYLMTQIYGIMLMRSTRRSVRLGLLYFASLYVGCFILNFGLPVFASPTLLWGIACAITITVLAIEPVQKLLASKVRIAYLFTAGLAVLVLLHQSCFILFSEDTAYGAFGLLVGGFGIYLFVAPLALFSLLFHLGTSLTERTRHFASFSIGLTAPFVALFIFCAAYFDRVKTIQDIPSSAYQLPQSVQILEHIQADWLSRLVFTNAIKYQQEPFLNSGRNAQFRKHSPFMYWAGKISDPLVTTKRDYNKFAQFFAQTGHDAEEALWSSTGLSTTSIDVQHEVNQATASVRSTYRMEATSKFSRQGEAIYTFQLPAGAVVTGSSLVVHGVEQPGRLSTKSKALEAYTRIVGRERRDPSLVEWRNGNTVAMRVFPVSSNLPRSFSIEVTAPLQKAGDRTFIAPLGIEGPPTSSARVSSSTNAKPEQEALLGFKEISSGVRGYSPKKIYLPSQEINTQRYVRDGMAYTLEPASPSFSHRALDRVYIDLTQGWTTVEVEQIVQATHKYLNGKAKVFGYNGNSVEITDENLVEVVTSAQRRKRSYFPMYAIGNYATSLLITRDQNVSFKYDAVKGSAWQDKIEHWLSMSKSEASLAHFHLGTDIPKYLRSIGNSRAISSETGSFETLLQRLADENFRIASDGPGIIEAFNGHARITALPTDEANSSGDPALLQLFIYRQSLLINLLQEPDSIAQEKAFISARQANAVTPFSSLIVLENDDDYLRFGIPNVIGPDKVDPPKAGAAPAVTVLNGQARASQNLDFVFEQGSGAVPEPHEWALILLSLVILAGFYIRRS